MSKPKKHNRGRPKNQRAGCLHCKYWKVNGTSPDKSDTVQVKRLKQRENDAA